MANALGISVCPDLFLRKGDFLFDNKNGQLRKILDTYGDLRNFAVLAQDCATACKVRTWLDGMEIPDERRPFLLSLSDTHSWRTGINHISFDYEESVRMAMEYILDDSITAQEPYLRMLDPVLKLIPQSNIANHQISNRQ